MRKTNAFASYIPLRSNTLLICNLIIILVLYHINSIKYEKDSYQSPDPLTWTFLESSIDAEYMKNYCNHNLHISDWLPNRPAKICLVPWDTRIILHLRESGNFEGALQKYLFNEIFPKYPKAAFVDIGANIGVYTVSAAALGRRVFAFEPMEDTFKAFSHSVLINDVSDSVFAFNYALEDKETCYKPEFLTGNPGATKIIKSNCSKINDSFVIKAGKLDQLLTLFEELQIKQAIIKMDVEGSEANVVAGGRKFLEQIDIPYIQMEMEHTRKFLGNPRTPEKEKLVIDMLNILSGKYVPTPSFGLQQLELKNAADWPFNIAWRRKESGKCFCQ